MVANKKEDVFSKIKKSDGCWEWLGTKTRGYGQFSVGRKRYRVHRLVYELAFGPIPEGKIVCHRCDNPSCANPDHLFLGTNLDNAEDRGSKGRHAFGERNGKSKLTSGDVIQMRKDHCSGVSIRRLAKLYGLSSYHTFNILHRKVWAHI